MCYLMTSKARLPARGSVNSAGLDLFSAETAIIEPQELKLLSTDLKLTFPSGTYGRIATRSGLTLQNKLIIPTGTIDPDYRGVIKIMMMNLDTKKYSVNEGDRIAQLICEKISFPQVKLCIGTPKQTKRGNNGFGSTGTK